MIKINLLKDTTNVGPAPAEATFATLGGGMTPEGPTNQKDILVKIFLLILPVLVAMFALTYVKDQRQQDLDRLRVGIKDLENKKDGLGPEIEAVKNFQKEKERLQIQIETIKSLSKERLRNVKALEAIQNLIPEKTWLVELRILEGKVLFLGQAVDDQSVAQFMQGLEENVFFSNVRLVKSSELNRSDGVVKVFEIESNVEGM
jgi:Tfp pilus assembly protein PilN